MTPGTPQGMADCDPALLQSYLDLHPQERAFLAELAHNRLDGDVALVFADWLEENGRTETGERVRRLVVNTGDVLVLTVTTAQLLPLEALQGKSPARMQAEAICEGLAALGKHVMVLPLYKSNRLEVFDPQSMRDRGWVVNSTEVLAALAAEREACARLAETWRERPDIQREDCPGCLTAYSEGMECGASRGIADAIRERGRPD